MRGTLPAGGKPKGASKNTYKVTSDVASIYNYELRTIAFLKCGVKISTEGRGFSV